MFVLLLASVASAQTNTPRFDQTEWALLTADVAARGLDVYSTHRALSGGNREVTLPGWVVNHPPVMAVYSGGIVVGQYYAARKLFPRHRKLAHLITAADVSITAPFAVRNLYMPLCASGYVDTRYGCQAPLTH
ncbi:MAG TPA: hypothetical protein VM554_03515 [Acidisarcina sp.]|nr:hypothetical protein [Acidisarcina sp.]